MSHPTTDGSRYQQRSSTVHVTFSREGVKTQEHIHQEATLQMKNKSHHELCKSNNLFSPKTTREALNTEENSA